MPSIIEANSKFWHVDKLKAKQQADDKTYMQIAELYAQKSKARRSKVGACLITSNGVILPGYNGTPPGTDNNCEYEEQYGIFHVSLITKPTVIHAELNCVMKASKEGISTKGCTIYVTLSPCEPCAAMLISAGVRRVVFKEQYRCTKGVDFLRTASIVVDQFKE